ncbi:MAG: DUF721 domain-containing protein [Spirochaetia bacterium]
MNEQDTEFSTPKNILPLILNDISKKGETKGTIFRGWVGIVGDKLFEQTKVIDIKNGTIFIASRDGSSMQLILLKKSEILAKLKKDYGGLGIEKLHVSIEKNTKNEQFSSVQSPAIPPKKHSINTDVDFQGLLKKIYGYSQGK